MQTMLLLWNTVFSSTRVCEVLPNVLPDCFFRSLVGSPEYMAPEIFSCMEYDAKLVDVWCCGITLYVMIVGRYPFHVSAGNSTREERLHKITMLIENLEYRIPDFVSIGCKTLLKKILTGCSDRIPIEEILVDPWFKKGLSQEALVMNDRILAQDQETMDRMDNIQTQQVISQLIEAAVV